MTTVLRRPELLLVLSLLLFAATTAWRWGQGQTELTLESGGVALESLSRRAQPRTAAEAAAGLQAYLRQNPSDSVAYAQLGSVYLQLARETGDPSFYTKADEVLSKALALDPQSVDAMVGKGTLALARHQFREALALGEQAHKLNPFRAQILGIIGDAQVELGRYDEAVATIQQMVDTRPDLSSYSRVAYVRELHGDVAGAIDAMTRAVEAGGPATENSAWTTIQLGHLFFNSGDLASAEQEYRRALALLPNYVHALAGIARIQAAHGEYSAAIVGYKTAIERMPLPEFVIALGELYEHTGQTKLAEEQWALVRAMQQLNAASGMDVDLELAQFEADRGQNLEQALVGARAAYERRPSIHAASVLAWALFRNGQFAEARRYSDEALRLGTRDATLHYRAGRIAEALGNYEAAQHHFAEALTINPFFSLRDAEDARARLSLVEPY